MKKGFLTKKVNYAKLGNFRFKKLGGENLLTNDGGNWLFLSQNDFGRFLTGGIAKSEPLHQELEQKLFFHPDKKKITKLASQYLGLNYSLAQGTSLFIVVLTLRCNHRCLYCQATPASPLSRGFDMSQLTAKKVVDLIFRTPSPFVRIEFQGGEPLLNWPVLKYIVRYAKELNQTKKRNLQISLVSNLTLLDDKKLKFLLDEGVGISCSFDGPAKVHNKNRVCLESKNSHQAVCRWIAKIQKAVKAKESQGRSANRLEAILTASRFSLPHHKEIIGEYLRRGFNNIFIRPLSPLGLSRPALKTIGYSAEDFIGFYQKSMDYILKLNLAGQLFIERNSYYALKKILNKEDPHYFEMRSPCGAGIGQLAFDYDGSIYTCDEGRMVARMNCDNFKLGDAYEHHYNQLIDNETTKIMCLASSLDNQAGCANCVYKPYCGTCPLVNFIEQGTIFPQITNTSRCKINKAMFDYLFLKVKSQRYRAVFASWLGKW